MLNPADLPGRESLGDYRIDKTLGQGAMGVVFVAHDKKLNRNVAGKVLSPQLCEISGFVERFQREAEAVAKLRHPNILQIYTIGEDRGLHYFAMEFVEGKSLSEILKTSGKYEFSQALDLIEQVAKGLMCAHEAKVIHRDIKPSNIMVDSSGRATITDFGIAKVEGQSTETDAVPGGVEIGSSTAQTGPLTMAGEIVGTPEYMAPEQAMGKEIRDSVDLYALGIMAYELLSGQLPFFGRGLQAILDQKMTATPPAIFGQSVSEAEKKMEGIVRLAIQPDPQKRPQTCRAFLKALVGVKEEMTKQHEMKAKRDITVQMTHAALAREARRQRGLSPTAVKVIATLICGGVLFGFLAVMWQFASNSDPLAKKGPAVVLTSNDVGQERAILGTVRNLEQYGDEIWFRLEHSGGLTWCIMTPLQYDENPVELMSSVEVRGIVGNDPDPATVQFVLNAAESGEIELLEVRKASPEEQNVLTRGPGPLANLANREHNDWVSVEAVVRSITEDRDPTGLWIEIEEKDRLAALWIPKPIADRLPESIGEGDTIDVTGLYRKEQDPTYLGRIEVISPDMIQLAG